MNNKLIIALDVETLDEARGLVSLLGAEAGMFKVGSQLFTAAGPDFVREIIRAGGRVFLDLKFHDIPNTVAAACTLKSETPSRTASRHAAATVFGMS